LARRAEYGNACTRSQAFDYAANAALLRVRTWAAY
jgi:hypothetical protein